jgi:hypothetical protein
MKNWRKEGKKGSIKISSMTELKQMRNSCNAKHGCTTATSYLQLDYDDKMNRSTHSLMKFFDT